MTCTKDRARGTSPCGRFACATCRDRRAGPGQAAVATVRPSAGSPHHTLSVDRDRLYARLGSPETIVPTRRGVQPDSYLVCLDLAAEGKEIWRVQPDEPDLAFEGSPIV